MFLSNRGSFRPETSGAYTLRRRGRRRPKSGSAIGACAVARLAGSGGPIGDYYGSANNWFCWREQFRRSARGRRELLFAHEASGTYVCTRELTHLESHPFLSLANRVSIGERYGYMSMVV